MSRHAEHPGGPPGQPPGDRPGDGRSDRPGDLPDVWQGEAPADVWQGPAPGGSGYAGEAVQWGEGAGLGADDEGATVGTGGVVYGDQDGPYEQTGEQAGTAAAPAVGSVRGSDGLAAARRAGRAGQSREERLAPSPATLITHHVVVPAATIAMVSSLLFFLFDLRSVFLPGAGSLKWIGFCFASATVLIARYGRSRGDAGTASGYTAILAMATVFAMAASPWQAKGVGPWGPLSNGLIIFGVWRFASRLTERLSVDLDRRPPRRPQLYGVERIEMERFEARHPDRPASVYDIGRRHLRSGRAGSPSDRAVADRAVADGEKALRDVVRLVLFGVLVFALGEPVLLAGPPEVGQRALVDMVIFLLASGMVLAAASTVQATQRLWEMGGGPGRAGAVGPGGAASRVGVAALAMIALLSLGLGTPGLHFEGSGRLQPVDARSGQASEQGQGDAEQRQETRDEGERREGAEETEAEAPEGDPTEGASSGRAQPTPPPVLSALSTLGGWLRWPLLLLVVLLGAWALWRHRATALPWLAHTLLALPARLFGAVRRALGQVVALLSRLFGPLLGRLARRPGKSKRGPSGGERPRDPFADLANLATAEPRFAILDAYARMLLVLEALGHGPEPDATPLEILGAWPGTSKEMRPSAERMTRAYLEAAYAPAPGLAADGRDRLEDLRQVALAALEEMRAPLCRRLDEEAARN